MAQHGGLRDVLIHNYMGGDLTVVWSVTQRRHPAVKQAVEAILEENQVLRSRVTVRPRSGSPSGAL